jgi:hypothetical protein
MPRLDEFDPACSILGRQERMACCDGYVTSFSRAAEVSLGPEYLGAPACSRIRGDFNLYWATRDSTADKRSLVGALCALVASAIHPEILKNRESSPQR